MNKIDLSRSTTKGTDIVCTWQDTGMFPLNICYSQMPLCHITTYSFFVSTTEKLGQPYATVYPDLLNMSWNYTSLVSEFPISLSNALNHAAVYWITFCINFNKCSNNFNIDKIIQFKHQMY